MEWYRVVKSSTELYRVRCVQCLIELYGVVQCRKEIYGKVQNRTGLYGVVKSRIEL